MVARFANCYSDFKSLLGHFSFVENPPGGRLHFVENLLRTKPHRKFRFVELLKQLNGDEFQV
jgi:hypothetical protein